MGHAHSVYDTDRHFSIDPISRVITNEFSTKNTVVQNDHNSERFTFELPRYIEGHDMSICDRVEVHYININSATKEENSGVYEIDDLQISPEDSSVVICSWLVSQNATKHEGITSFLLRFACTTDGELDYVWNTAIYSEINVSKGIYNSGTVVYDYADILAQWHRDLFETGGNAVVNIKDAESKAIEALKNAATAKEQEVLDNIPDDYQTLDANVTKYKSKVDSLANAIKGKLKGAVVRADDVSPVEHTMGVRVFPLNRLEFVTHQSFTATSTYKWVSALKWALVKGTYVFSATSDFGISCRLWIYNDTELFINIGDGESFVLSDKDAKSITDIRVVIEGLTNGESYEGNVYPQITEGTTPTEYTPYVDPASVTVTKCGKNLVEITGETTTIDGVTFTVNNDGSVTVNGTAEANVFYKAGKINLAKNGRFYLSGGVANSNVTTYMLYLHDVKSYFDFYDYGDGKAFTPTGGTCDVVIAVYKGATTNNIVFYPMIEAGETKTKFEKFEQLTTYTPTTDGTILDITSLSPTMTLLTDTEGAVVECEYNRDTNAVILDLYNKIADLSATT